MENWQNIIWNERTARYLEEPYHDINSNYADSFRYLAQAVGHIETVSSLSGAFDRHKKAVEQRSRRVY